MRVRALAAGVVVSVVLLSACEAGGEEPAGLDESAATPAATGDGVAVDDDGGSGADDDGGATEPVDDPSTPAEDEEWAIEAGTDAPQDAADLAVYEAYLAYWHADFTALNIPDPAHQPFLDAAVDPQRERIVAVAEQLVADGLRTVGTLRIEPVVVSVNGPTAAIQDCMDGRDTYDVDAEGTEAPDSRGALIPVVVQLLQDGAAWVVADIQEADHDCG